MLENESDNSVEDSDVEISNEETLRLPILDIEKPSTPIELKNLWQMENLIWMISQRMTF